MNSTSRRASLPDPDQRIAVLAAGQHGVITRRQLLDAGVSSKMIEGRQTSGRLVPIHRGVYLLGTLTGDLEPSHARVMAAVLACGRGAAASHLTAGRLWEIQPRLPLSRSGRSVRTGRSVRSSGSPRSPPSPPSAQSGRGDRAGRFRIDVSVMTGRPRRPGIRVHRPRGLTARDLMTVDGIPVTSPLRTLRDLCTVLTPRELNRALARAERRGLVSRDELATLLARLSGRPGAPVLRAALVRDGGPTLTRSKAEELFLDIVASARLPAPEANVLVEGYEVDFLWRAARVVVEVDGRAYHSGDTRFEADRRRDRNLSAAGYRVLRITWRQLTRERDETLASMAGVLAVATAAR